MRDSVGREISDAKTPADYKQKMVKILEHKKNGIYGICGYHLIGAYLTRNYFSHKIKFEPDMLGSLFIEVYTDLLLTLISLFVKKGEFDKALVV